MKYLLVIILVALSACGAEQKQGEAEYLAAVKNQQEGYFSSDAKRAYEAEVQFIAFVKERQRIGGYLPNPQILVWEYPRLALIAEYCGQKEESSRLFIEAEQYARTVYPNEPASKTSAAALREAIDKITDAEKVPWKK